jgi:glycerol-3-phosphate dehydrogenase subunit C
MKGNFDIALKVGKPVARQALQSGKPHIASECPLAADHIVQGMERLATDGAAYPHEPQHPIQLFAKAYGLM